MQSFVRIVAVASVALAASAGSVAAQTLPAAADLVAKHVAAIGGKDAIMKITSMSQSGTLEIPAMGLTAKTEMQMAAPNKMSVKQSIPGMGEMMQGYNGTVGWSVNPMQGPRLLADKELEQTKEQADFVANMLYQADRYSSMETQSIVDFNGEKAYKVRMVRKPSGREETVYFSVANGLVVGGETSQESEMGKMQLVMTASEYKQFGPIKVATKTEATAGPTKIITTITDVTLNGVPATAFDAPAQVKALIKN